MSNTALVWKSFKAMRWVEADALRDLIAAMPIVILARALRDALQRRPRARPSMLGPNAIDH